MSKTTSNLNVFTDTAFLLQDDYGIWILDVLEGFIYFLYTFYQYKRHKGLLMHIFIRYILLTTMALFAKVSNADLNIDTLYQTYYGSICSGSFYINLGKDCHDNGKKSLELS